MKKLFLFAFILLSVCAGKVMAQNIQLHYDLGRALYKSLDERPWVTTTVEMFKADKWGSTYFFVDMDYGRSSSGSFSILSASATRSVWVSRGFWSYT